MKPPRPGTAEETPHAVWQSESHDGRPLLSGLGRMCSSESINLSGPTAWEGWVAVGPSSGCQHTPPCIPGCVGPSSDCSLHSRSHAVSSRSGSLLSPGLRPHTFAPTPTSTRQELGRDVGHQCRRPPSFLLVPGRVRARLSWSQASWGGGEVLSAQKSRARGNVR